MDEAAGIAEGDQTLSSRHGAAAWVESPGDPVGGGDAGVPVGDVDGVVGLVVVPVEKGVEDWEAVASRVEVVVGELVFGAGLSVG